MTRTNLLLLCNRVFVHVFYVLDKAEDPVVLMEKSELKSNLLALLAALLERAPHDSLVRARVTNLLEFEACKVSTPCSSPAPVK